MSIFDAFWRFGGTRRRVCFETLRHSAVDPGGTTGKCLLLSRNPIADAVIQHVERQSAVTENFVVEGADVEFIS
jgi:hypothetical protein